MKSDLVVLSGDQVGRILQLGAHTIIGRSGEAQLSLMGDLVSRHHCEIRTIGEVLRVRDMGSTNGILLNGKSVEDERIHAVGAGGNAAVEADVAAGQRPGGRHRGGAVDRDRPGDREVAAVVGAAARHVGRAEDDAR